MKLLTLAIVATIVSACPLSDLQLVETHPYAAEIKGQGEKAHGARNFREINQTMSRVTGVDSNNQQVLNVYNEISEMLPRDNAIDSFSGPVQVGIVRLASEYCGQMLANGQLVKDKLPEIDFSSPPSVVLAVEQRPQVATAFIDSFWGKSYRTTEDGQRAVTDLVDIIDQEMLASNPRSTRAPTQLNRGLLGQIMMSLCTTTLASAPLIFF